MPLEILTFDIESNGLLDTISTIHCISMQPVDEQGNALGPVLSSNDHGTGDMTVREAVARLAAADRVVGHNIANFDIPAIAKLFPGFKVKSFIDTLLLATLVFPDIRDKDFEIRKRRLRENKPELLTTKLIGRQSLEAWGYRLGFWKGDYAKIMKDRGLDPWAEWNQEMDDYCDQDVVVTQHLLQKLMSKELPLEAILLEQAVAPILSRQHTYGFYFDTQAASKLEATLLGKRTVLEEELRKIITPWRVVARKFIPKRNDKRRGYVAGVEAVVYKDVVFNPRSRQQIADRLSKLYGWRPTEFTDKGQPKIDEDVLGGLDYPVIPLLLEHFVVNKRLGQLSEGDEAWLKAVRKDSRIHGSVNQNAAVTGRMTHSKPNVAQVPAVGVPYGEECRALFCVPKGKKLVGCDASGLELRCLAHYMGRYDGGAYADVILHGDIHTENQTAAGLPTRKQAKTFISMG